MSDRVRVWCLRHAESEQVTIGMTGAAGAVPAAPLTARGRRQAINAARTLATEPITTIYSSTAPRARQTAELLATTPGLSITDMPEMVEADCTADVLRAWVVEQDLGRRAADGETGQQVVARVTAAFQQIAGAHPRETVAVVGHAAHRLGGALRARRRGRRDAQLRPPRPVTGAGHPVSELGWERRAV
jgi:alpha-ribazole phosphatase/probable phosphoglycerate mutase